MLINLWYIRDIFNYKEFEFYRKQIINLIVMFEKSLRKYGIVYRVISLRI